MFKKTAISAIALWALLLFGSYSLLYHTPGDKQTKTYQKFLAKYQTKEEPHQNEALAKQNRENVSKQILYKKGEERLESRISGDSSCFLYSKKDGEFVEHFTKLECVMQEKKNEQIEQDIRHLKSENATYSYKTGILQADNVSIAHYLLPNHTFPTTLPLTAPILQGQAESIRVFLFEKKNAQIQKFTATFQNRNEK